MRAVVQRVLSARVDVSGQTTGAIDAGLLAYVGVTHADSESDVLYLADKLIGLRVFTEGGKMTRTVEDIDGGMLIVSQFTLFGDVRRGRRPSFSEAAKPDLAETLYERLLSELAGRSVKVASGLFGADMAVHCVVDGPVTIQIDTKKLY